ncbi:MAG TPA: threonine ammonia-lyase [Longimicrobiales bacterium]|nr:threonine ammonia-lyase [Longimicrobiales bacterium]
MLTISEVRAARERIADGILRTPCPPASGLHGIAPCRVHVKLESLQRTGSFKDRGSLNRLLDLTPAERVGGVVTASAGNHAQAVAYHCARLGIPATVVMPEGTPLVKVTNTRRFGARIFFRGTTLSDASDEVRRLESEEGLTVVHAFDDDRVIAGQGTVGLEMIEQVPDITIAVVPIGGGGLISGIAIALRDARPDVRIVGVEAEVAASALASRHARRVIRIETSETIADGIATKQIGERTFPIIEKLVDEIVTVTEEETAAAVHTLLERQKLVAEGAGAVPLAALMSGRVAVSEGDNAVLVVSGGNIDVNLISRIIDRGLLRDGRLARLMIKVRDRPGNLARLADCVARTGANVLDIAHRRAFADIRVGDVEIVMHLETRGREHVEEIIAALEREGLVVEEDV